MGSMVYTLCAIDLLYFQKIPSHINSTCKVQSADVKTDYHKYLKLAMMHQLFKVAT